MNGYAMRNIFWILTVSVLLSGCGLATSSADRIARAEERIESGRYREASIELKNALASDADNARARYLLALVSHGLGDILAAEKELQRAAELGAPEEEVQALHLEILLGSQRFTDILAYLGTVSVEDQDQLRYFRGNALLGVGSLDAARETFNEWASESPDSVDARVGLAGVEMRAGNPDAAIEILSQVVSDAAENSEAWQALATAQVRVGDYAAAERSLVSAEQHIAPETDIQRYASLLGQLVEARLALQKNDEARLSLNRLSGVMPQSPATFFLSARLARSDGDYSLAARHLQELLNLTPDNVNAQLFLANVQMMQRNFAQAERLLHRVVALAPDNLQARKLLARVQLHQAEPSDAAEALAPVLERHEDDPDLFEILAEASIQQGDVESAIRRLRSAVELAPTDMDAQLNLAAAYLAADQSELSLEVLSSVPEGAGPPLRRERLLLLALDAQGDTEAADRLANELSADANGDEMAVSIVAEYYLQSERDAMAIDVLRRAIAQNGSSVIARNMLARIQMSQGDLDAANITLGDVLQVEPSDLGALLGLAQIAEAAGEDEEALQLLLQAAEAHPDAIPPKVMLATRYLRNGDGASAEPLADELVTIGFANAYVSQTVARVFEANGRVEEALNQFERAAKLDPQSAVAQFGMARAFAALDRSVDAREALQRALQLRPGWMPAMAMLVLVEFRQGDLNDAANVIAEMRTLDPDSPVGMILEGDLQLRRENYKLAAESYGMAVGSGGGRSAVLRQYRALVEADGGNADRVLQSWLSSQPEDNLVRRQLAEHLLLNGQGDRAIAEYERVLQSQPNDAAVLNNIAWQHRESGRLDIALEFAERARSIRPDSGSVIDTLAWIHRDLGELDKSLELLTEAAEISPGNGEIQFHLAKVLIETGDNERARRILQDLVDNDARFPSRREADQLLGQL